MYRTVVTSPQQAVAHLLLHCSGKDGEFHTRELNFIGDALELLGGEKMLNLDREIEHYIRYRKNIGDENDYLSRLVRLIQPRLGLALLWQCIQIVVKDSSVAFGEEVLLQKIARLMHVPSESLTVLYDLASQVHKAQAAKAF